jgi:hypothetical protein
MAERDSMSPDATREKRRRWLDPFTVRTLAVSIALIATIFLTRNRWEAWVVEKAKPQEPIAIQVLSLVPDAQRAVLFWDDSLCLWDVETGEPLAVREFGEDYCGALSRDGRKAAFASVRSAGGNDLALVLDARTGDVLASLEEYVAGVSEVRFSNDGRFFIAAGLDGYVRVWNADDGRLLAKLGRHNGALSSAEFSPDDDTILTGAPGDVRIWDRRTGAVRTRLLDEPRETTWARFCAMGRRVFIKYGKRCVLVDSDTGAAVATFPRCGRAVVSVDRRLVAVWTEVLGEIHLVDGATGSAMSGGRWQGVKDLALSEDGGLLFVGHSVSATGDTMSVVDTRRGSVLATIRYDLMQRFWLSWDCTRLLTKERWTPARLYDSRTGRLLREWPETWPAGFLGNDRFLLHRAAEDDTLLVMRRIRPEQWWGVFCLWHFWLITVLFVAFVVSIWRDVRSLRRRQESPM